MSSIVAYERCVGTSRRARGLSVASARSQRGVVLFIALIVLVAMTLAGIALVRSVDTANVISGNLAFKQGMAPEADTAVEAAVIALSGPSPAVPAIPTPTADNIAQNYWATKQPDNASGVPTALVAASAAWPFAATNATTKNTVYYMIDRLCRDGALPPVVQPNEADCSLASEDEKGGSQQANKTGAEKVPIYRITVRVDGPHNTQTYTQSFVSVAP